MTIERSSEASGESPHWEGLNLRRAFGLLRVLESVCGLGNVFSWYQNDLLICFKIMCLSVIPCALQRANMVMTVHMD